MTETRAARDFSVPISVLRGEREPGKKWNSKDRVFALSLTAYEAELCRGCGQPMSMTSGERPHDYEIDHVRCMACAELEEYQELTRKPQSGEKTFVTLDEDSIADD